MLSSALCQEKKITIIKNVSTVKVCSVTCQVNSDDVVTAVAADTEYGGLTLRAGEAEREAIIVGVTPVCCREAVVQHA